MSQVLISILRHERKWLLEQLAAAWEMPEQQVFEMMSRDTHPSRFPSPGTGRESAQQNNG